jgi:hypothetical protein
LQSRSKGTLIIKVSARTGLETLAHNSRASQGAPKPVKAKAPEGLIQKKAADFIK